MHVDFGQLREDVGHGLEPGPVELQVLPCAEVPVAAVVCARDAPQRAQLRGGKQPVRDRDAQHRRVALHVEAVLQSQRPEFVLGQFPGEVAARLVAELRHPLLDDAAVVGVVSVHGRIVGSGPYS